MLYSKIESGWPQSDAILHDCECLANEEKSSVKSQKSYLKKLNDMYVKLEKSSGTDVL